MVSSPTKSPSRSSFKIHPLPVSFLQEDPQDPLPAHCRSLILYSYGLLRAPGYANTAGHTLRDFALAGAGSAALLAFLRGGWAAASESEEDESSLEDDSLLLSEDVPATGQSTRVRNSAS